MKIGVPSTTQETEMLVEAVAHTAEENLQPPLGTWVPPGQLQFGGGLSKGCVYMYAGREPNTLRAPEHLEP